MQHMKLAKDLDSAIKDFLIEDFKESSSFYENFGSDAEVETIPHESFSGFIPFYNGGYRLMLPCDMGLATGTGSYPPSLQTEIDRLYEACEKDYEDSAKNGDYEDYGDYQTDWFSEGTEFWYTLQVMFCKGDNNFLDEFKGEDRILVLSGVNTDYTYGRCSGLDVKFEQVLPVKDLTRDTLVKVLTTAVDSIN